MSTIADDVSTLLQQTGEQVGRTLDAAFRTVAVLRERTAEVLTTGARTPTTSSLESLHPLLRQLLAEEPNPLEGVGVAFCPGVLADADRWLEWWRRGPSGQVSFTRHVLDPSALGFYDYQSRPWFRTPLQVGRPVAVGPYLDAGGCDVYTTTMASPLAVAPGKEVVVGGDLDMAHLEAAFLAQVGQRQPAVAVVSGTDRVVVSNTALLMPGSRLHQQLKDDVVAELPVPSQVPGSSSWRLVALGER